MVKSFEIPLNHHETTIFNHREITIKSHEKIHVFLWLDLGNHHVPHKIPISHVCYHIIIIDLHLHIYIYNYIVIIYPLVN